MEFSVITVAYCVHHLICSMIWSIQYTYFATFTTNRVALIGDDLYNSNWYDYSLELRKHAMLIIMRSQKVVRFTGFKVVTCTLEVLLTVSILAQPF